MTAKAGQKVLLSVFATFEVGGPQLRFCEIANHFGKKYRHFIVAMDGEYACKTRLGSELDFELLRPEIRKGATLANRGQFRNVLRSIRPDCLITDNWGSIEWAMANWPRLVRHVHIEDGFGPEEADSQLLRRALTRRLVLRGSVVVVPSHRLETIATQVWKLNATCVRYVPNGIDCARFGRTPIAPLVPRDDIPLIGTVAALRVEKNLQRMLDVFRSLRAKRRCRLLITGDGPARAELEAYAAELGVGSDVVFSGYTTETERAYASMDLFMLSSDTEQMPTSVIEAMAAGLPVVATDVGDVTGMVARDNRAFVVAKEVSALQEAAERLLDDPALRRHLGEANRARAIHEFSRERMFAAYGALFDGTY